MRSHPKKGQVLRLVVDSRSGGLVHIQFQMYYVMIVMKMHCAYRVEYLCSQIVPYLTIALYHTIPLFIEDTSGRAPTLSAIESGTTIV